MPRPEALGSAADAMIEHHIRRAREFDQAAETAKEKAEKHTNKMNEIRRGDNPLG